MPAAACSVWDLALIGPCCHPPASTRGACLYGAPSQPRPPATTHLRRVHRGHALRLATHVRLRRAHSAHVPNDVAVGVLVLLHASVDGPVVPQRWEGGEQPEGQAEVLMRTQGSPGARKQG
jgi:hypothetical protein